MYQAIVFLPLLGAIIAALISPTGAHARFPGGVPETAGHGGSDAGHGHAAHATADDPHAGAHAGEPAAAGSRPAELVTTVFLFASMVLAWFAFVDVGFGHHDARV